MAGERPGRHRVKHILIDRNKVPIEECAFSLPWNSASLSMNFSMPEEVIVPHEIPLLYKDDVESMVIGCRLDDYDFLKEFHNLTDLYIYDGRNVDDISFVESMTYLKQFVLHGSKIHSIQPLVTLLERKKEKTGMNSHSVMDWFPYAMEGICVSSDENIHDMDRILPYRRYCSEVILNGRSLF